MMLRVYNSCYNDDFDNDFNNHNNYNNHYDYNYHDNEKDNYWGTTAYVVDLWEAFCNFEPTDSGKVQGYW